jgi:hypothetical protein
MLLGMVSSSARVSRQMPDDSASLAIELRRWQAEKGLRLHPEQSPRMGVGVDSDIVMAWVSAVRQKTFAGRVQAETALDPAHETFGQVTAGVATLHAHRREGHSRLVAVKCDLEGWLLRKPRFSSSVSGFLGCALWMRLAGLREGRVALHVALDRPMEVASLRHLIGSSVLRDVRGFGRAWIA